MIFKRFGLFVLDMLQVIVFAVSIFLFVYLLIMQPHKIKGASMEPSFYDSEFLLTDKVSYRFNEPSRGDVIVFEAPVEQKEEFIKRIIGLPGEEITVIDGFVIINGRKLIEPYLAEGQKTPQGSFLKEGQSYKIPAGMYIVMGDNRDRSLDSRSIGPVERDKITGRAWVVYWPPSEAGKIEKPIYTI